MKKVPLLEFVIGDASFFAIRSLIYTEESLYAANEKRKNLYETSTIVINGIDIGNSYDFEIAGVSSTAFITVLDRLNKNSGIGNNLRIPLGSNFDNYSIYASGYDNQVAIAAYDENNTNIASTSKPIPYQYFSFICESYKGIVAGIKDSFVILH